MNGLIRSDLSFLESSNGRDRDSTTAAIHWFLRAFTLYIRRYREMFLRFSPRLANDGAPLSGNRDRA